MIPLLDPMIIHKVEVRSNKTPRVKKIKTGFPIFLFLKSRMVAIKYDNNARLTIEMPAIKTGFIL